MPRRGDTLPAPASAALLAVLACVAVIGPVVAALSEQDVYAGEDALHAFLLGVEVACRVGLAVYTWHYGRGWHITGVYGPFGAAAACAGGAFGQATHTATIWIEGPDEVLPGTTFTLDVWGRFESPDFVEGVSAIAGFGLDVICTAGRDEVVEVDGPGWSGGGFTLVSLFTDRE